MAESFRTLIGIAFDKNQAESELNRQIKSLKNSAKLALDIDLNDNQAKKVINDSSKAWSNYRKEAVAAITAPNTELQKMSQYYKKIEQEIQNNIKLHEKEAYTENKRINDIKKAEVLAYQEDKKRTAQKQQEIQKLGKLEYQADEEDKKRTQQLIDLEKQKYLIQQDAYKLNQKYNQNSINLDFGKSQLNNNISSYLQNNTKLSTDLKNRLLDVQNQIKDVDSTELGNLKKNFRTIQTEATSLGKTGDSVFTRLNKNIFQFLGFLGSATIVMTSINSVKGMITEVKNLDKAMIGLKKVTDETESSYRKFLDTATSSAQKLGTKVTDIIEMTADWARAGYSLKESAELAEISTIFQNVAEIDAAKSVSNIITPLKAFNIEASEAIKIVDAINEVDNKFSVSAADIGDGLSNAASALALAGNDLNQTLALISGGSEITQNANEMGNALKVLAMRLRGMKGELEDIGEEYDNIESVSKIQTQIYNLTKGQVNILDDLDPTKFKSTYDILEGISKVWNDISQVEQADLLEIIAGKQRGNQVAALLQSFQSGQTQKALTTAIESQNSAYREQEARMNGIEFSAERLNASLQKLSSNTVNSGWIKGFYDLSNVLVNVVDKIGIFNIALMTTFGILGGKGILMIPKLATFIGSLIQPMLGASVAAGTLAGTIGAISSTVLPVAGILLAFKGISVIYDKLNVTAEEQAEKTSKLIDEYNELESQLGLIESEINNIGLRIDELNSKDNLTIVENNELEKLKNTNEQLNIRNELLKEQARIKQQEVAKSVSGEVDTYMNTGYDSILQLNEYNARGVTVATPKVISRENYIKELMSEYERLSDINIALISDEDTKKMERYKKQLVDMAVDIGDYTEKYGIEDDISDSWREFVSEIYNTVNPIKEVSDEIDNNTNANINNKSSWKDVIDSVDKFKASIATITDAMSNLNNLSDGDILDLLTQFPQLAEYGYTGSEGLNVLKSALVGVSKEMYNSLDVTARENVLIKSLIENLNDLAYSFDSGKIVDELLDIEKILDKVRKKQSLSADEMVKLITKYESLAGAVRWTSDGYSLEESALSSLISTKAEDANIAITAQINQTQNTINQIDARIGAYKAEARALDELARSYNKSVSGIGEYIRKYGEGSAYDTFGMQAVINYQNTIEDGNSILDSQLRKLDELQSSLLNVNRINEKSGTPSTKKTKEDSTKDFRQELDYIQRRFEATERAVSKLNNAYQNADTDNQVEALEKLIQKQTKLTGIYKNGAKEYRKMYESNLATINKLGFDADSIFNDIKWGKNSVDIFEDLKVKTDDIGIQEQLYNAIQNTIKNWNNYSSAVDNKLKVEYEIDGNEEQLNILMRNIGLSGIEKSLDSLSEVNDELSTLETLLGDVTVYDEFGKMTANGATKVLLLNSQLQNAEKSLKLYKDQLKILEEQYLSGMWATDEYDDKLKELNSSYRSSLESVKSLKDNILSLVIDGINAETEASRKNLDIRLALLAAQKKQDDNNKSLLEKQKRLALLQTQINALQGNDDRENRAQRYKLEEEYAELKKQLDEEVADITYDTTVDTLNKEQDEFEKAQDKKIDELKNSLQQQEYAINNSLDLVSGKYESVYQNLVDLAKSYGVQISDALTSPLENAMGEVSSTGQSGNGKVNNSAFSVLTKNTSGVKQTAETGLNQYLIEKGYNKLSWDEMYQLANSLGMTDVTLDNIKNSGFYRGQILTRLKQAGFSKGGYPEFDDMVKATGEHGIALVKRGEPILTQQQGSDFKTLISNLEPLNKITHDAIGNYTTTNNPVQVSFESLINIDGNVYDEPILQEALRQAGIMMENKVPKIISNELWKIKR